MESVFNIGGCAIDNQVKFATYTLLGATLTWWNGHVRTLGHDAAYAMTWEILKKKFSDKYCPKGEIKKLEIELWNLKTEKVDKYISRLPDNIHGNVMKAENKRKLDDNNQAQQQLLKKQNVVQAYAVGSGEKKSYGGSKPLCPKCNYHHDGECAPKCTNCKKVGHLIKDCWHPINTNNQRTITCYECGNQGHYMSDCSVLKNQCNKA
ncbi:reverse transcriptase domain-containing protein [Tanacetum coccineum]|uniref:Reverse transcriptase domain-containing protein n=1 Tax=Tanacetum coccineum TaxID=301880 RepID=A0ABQ4Z1V2_9ASTR